MLARVIAIATCPSDCHEPVLCQNEESVMISSLAGSPRILVFWRQISSSISKGFPPSGISNKGGVGKFNDFLALASISRKR